MPSQGKLTKSRKNSLDWSIIRPFPGFMFILIIRPDFFIKTFFFIWLDH